MKYSDIHNIYFIGIGGIGMSALAKYFLKYGKNIAGYDRTPSDICYALESRGASIHYEDNENMIPEKFRENENTLVIYTPAVGNDNNELQWFEGNNYLIKKRSVVLGEITNSGYNITVAGTHGKTTISSCIAHIYTSSEKGCNAFLGGISKNYNENFLNGSHSSGINVIEADEYDRSFLQLSPDDAIITSVDPDHLDIYGNRKSIDIAFTEFVKKIKAGGKLLIKKESSFCPPDTGIEKATYSAIGKADCYISGLRLTDGKYTFDVFTPWGRLENVKPGVPGKYNTENTLAAAALCLWNNIPEDKVKKALAGFTGVSRRFDVRYSKYGRVYIDDYAHHPEEIKAFISSVREIYPGKKITGIFQPHLYSRTRDFAENFGLALSMLDELVLLEIYPAREEPIKGVSPESILKYVNINKKAICPKAELLNMLEPHLPEVLLTMGAGDIDQFVKPICNLYENFG